MRTGLRLQHDVIATQIKSDLHRTVREYGGNPAMVETMLDQVMPHIQALLVENDVVLAERDNALFHLGRHE